MLLFEPWIWSIPLANVAEEIVNERKQNGDYENIFDFVERVSGKVVNKKTMESLAKSGSFDKIHNNRKQINDSCEILSLYSKTCEKCKIHL